MGVGHAQQLEQALDRAVLAEAAVQRVEDRVGARLERAQQIAEVAPDVDRQRRRSRFWRSAFGAARRRSTARPRARPTVRPSGRRRACSSARLLRQAARRRCAGSPSASVDAASPRARAGAPSRRAPRCRRRWRSPVLIRKLQCFSETMAPPQREAAAAGAIDQLPGLLAGRIGEGAAAGAAADRLGRLARGLDLGHAGRRSQRSRRRCRQARRR